MLRLININRRLGDFALTDINLEVADGEYYVLLADQVPEKHNCSN